MTMKELKDELKVIWREMWDRKVPLFDKVAFVIAVAIYLLSLSVVLLLAIHIMSKVLS